MTIFRYFVIILLACLHSELFGAVKNRPTFVPVKFHGLLQGDYYYRVPNPNYGLPGEPEYLENVALGQSTYSELNGLSTSEVPYIDEASLPYGTTNLEPYKTYSVGVGRLPSTVFPTTISGFFTAIAPPGYRIELNGFIRNRFTWSGGYLTTPIRLRIIEDGTSYEGPVATSSEIESGRIRWQVSLGSLSDGRHAGSLALIGHGRGSDWATYRKAAALAYESKSGDVYVYKSGGVMRQIYAPQSFVDITQTSSALIIKFFHPDQINGANYPKTFSGVPFETYTIQKGGTATSLSIVRETRDVNSKTDAAVVSSSMKTSLVRSGNPPDFTWTLATWAKASETTPLSEEIRVWAANTGGFVETTTVKNPHDGLVSYKEISTKKRFAWGGELPIDIIRGETNPETGNISYYENSTSIGSYAGVKLSRDAGGGWQYIEYAASSDPANVGNVIGIYSPFTTAPTVPGSGVVPTKSNGAYIKYTYSADPFKMKRRFASAEKRINDVLVSKQVNTYENISVNSKEAIRVTRKLFTDNATGALIAKDIYYREDVSDYFYRNQLHSTSAPDGTRQSYVRQRGTLDLAHRWGNPTAPSVYTFTPAATPTTRPYVRGSRICVLNGLIDEPGGAFAATRLTTQYGYTISGLWVVHAKSTMDVTLRDYMGRVLRTETHVWNRPGAAAGAWEVIAWKDYYYDRASNLTKTVDNSGNIYEANYSGGVLEWERAADGSYKEYAYDNARRPWKVTTHAKGPIGARVMEYKYDASGRIVENKIYSSAETPSEAIISSTNYDTAGRVISATKEGVAVASYGYEPLTRTATETAPDGGTKITETYLDGQIKSTTGTGVVASHYTYGVETDGRTWTTVTEGTESSGRYTKSWKDLAGREIRRETPGFTAQPVIVETQAYHATRGLLVRKTKGVVETNTDRRTIADTLNEHDVFGALVRTGLDINANGTLDLAGPDTAAGSSSSFYKDGNGHWWQQSKNAAHLTTGSPAETTASITRSRLTGFSGNTRAETKTYGAETNFSNLQNLDEVDCKTEWTEIVHADGKVLSYVKHPHMASSSCDTSYNGLVTQSEGADGITITQHYDDLWRSAGTTHPRTGVSTQTYRSGTNLVESQYDARGLANGRIATFGYDLMGRVISQTDAKGFITRTAYTPRGEVWRVWGDAALPMQAGYNDFGQRVGLTTYRSTSDDPIWAEETWPAAPPAGDTTTWDYDLPSRLLWKQTDAQNRLVEYSYDERGQLYQRKWARKISSAPGAAQITTTYDYKRAPVGAQATEYYDGGGTASKITYNDGTPSVIYGPVDRSGRPANVQDYAGTRTFNYDAVKPWRGLNAIDLPAAFYGQRKISRVREDVTNTSAGTYNEHTLATQKGRVVGFELSAPGSTAIDLKQTAKFSNSGRFAGVDLPLTTRSFLYGYKANSALLSGYAVSDLTFTLGLGYEPQRDLITQVSSRWGTLRVVSQYDYTYDVGGMRDTLTASGEATQHEHGANLFTDFNYDGRGQLLAAKVGRGGDLLRPLPGRQFGFSYDTIGNRLSSTRTKLAEADAYTPNSLNQIEQRTNRFISASGLATSLARVAVHEQLADRSGNYWHAIVPNPVDPASNFPGYVHGAVSAATIGTAAGGKDSAQTQPCPLIFPPSVEVSTYDEDGNLKSDGVYAYTWDAENRLAQVEPKAITGAPADLHRRRATFRYDYLSRRIEKTVETAGGTGTPSWVQSERRRFLYQGWNLFAEFSVATNGALSLLKSYTWGLDLGGALTASGGVGALLQIRNHVSGAVHLPTYDAGGNVSTLVNPADGAIVAAYEYGPFGELISSRGSASKENPFRFSTKYFDEEAGLYYYGYRYYDPHDGRFINRDPLGEKGGLNLYAFVGNSPISGFDIWGLQGEEFGDYGDSVPMAYNADNAFAMFSSTLGVFQEAGNFLMQGIISFASGLYTEPFPQYSMSVEEFQLYQERVAPVYEFTAAWSSEMSDFFEDSYSAITPEGFDDTRQQSAEYTGYVYTAATIAEVGVGIFSKSGAASRTASTIDDAAAPGSTAGVLDEARFDAGQGNPVRLAALEQAENIAAPTGKFYSAAFETTLDSSVLGKSRSIHFNRANSALDSALSSDAAFASRMEELIPGVRDAVSKVGGRQTPGGWIWHHEQATGVMRLVPEVQHTPGSMFWETLHPGGRGGYSIWGIPNGAPPN